jgi:hypothetical protein
VVIYIDKEEKWRSEKLRKTLSPRLQENVPMWALCMLTDFWSWRSLNCLRSFQPSSPIKIELLRSGSLLHRGDSVLGRFTGQVVDLIENGERNWTDREVCSPDPFQDTVLHLKDEKIAENGLQMKVKLTLAAEPSGLDIRMADVDDSIARIDGTASFSEISKYVDTSTSVVSAAQAAYESAQTFGSSIAPLGQALESLQQIVSVVDGFADVRLSSSVTVRVTDSLMQGPSNLQSCMDSSVVCVQGKYKVIKLVRSVGFAKSLLRHYRSRCAKTMIFESLPSLFEKRSPLPTNVLICASLKDQRTLFEKWAAQSWKLPHLWTSMWGYPS